MADAFRGLTLRIGADAQPLQRAISSIKTSARQAETQFRAMNKALKFDSGNIQALTTRLDLAEDKARLTARSAADIGIAMRQASERVVEFSAKSGGARGKLEAVARQATNIYSSTQRIQSEYNHVNEELEAIYNKVRKVVAADKGWKEDSEELDNYMKRLKSSYGKTGDEAKKLTSEMQRYISEAMRTKDLGSLFGLEKNETGKLLAKLKELRTEHRRLNNDLDAAHAVEGYRAMRTQLIAIEAELRQAAVEATRFRTEIYEMGSSRALRMALSDVRALDGAIDNASASARAMDEAFRLMPKNAEAAVAKVRAMRDESELLKSKLEAARNVVKKIEADSAFDEQARDIKNVHAALAKAESEAAEFGAKLKKAEERAAELKREIDEGNPKIWAEQGTSLEKLQAELKETTARLGVYKQKFEEADARHRSASMANAYRKAKEEVISLEAALARLSPKLQKINATIEKYSTIRTMGYGLYSTITPALMMLGRYAIDAAENIDSAYRDMRKTVNGTEEDFESLKAAAIDFSRTHVTTAQQLLEIESIGGQLGIAVENLAAFGEVVSNLDIATNIDAEDIATYVGQLSNIMRDIDTSNVDQYQQDITSFSDALVRLGNNSAAQESNIMKVMMRIAALGNISGFTTPQLLGISTAIAATGQGSEAAGTAIARTFSNIEAAVGRGGDKLKAFADVAGMSAEDFADAWNGDPITAFTAFIRGLREIDDAGGSVDNTLASLGINSVRQKNALENLTNTFDIMTSSIGMSENAWAGLSSVMVDGKVEMAGDAAREAQRKSEGFSGAIQILRNNATALGEVLGNSAAPMITALSVAFQGLTGFVSALPGPLQTAITAFGGLTAAAGPAAIAVGAVGTAINNFKKMRLDKAAHRAELIAVAEAALEAALGEESLAKKQEKQALAAMRAAAANGDDAAAKVAAAAATAAHEKATEAENAVQAANTELTIANGGAKGILTGIQATLTKSTWKLAVALGVSNGMLLAIVAGAAAASIAIYAIAKASRDAVDPANKLTKGTEELKVSVESAKTEYEQMSRQFGENSDEALAAKAAYEELEEELANNSKTAGQLASEMQEVAMASEQLRSGLAEGTSEAESSSGALLNVVNSINQLKDSQDAASSTKLAAYIATLNGEIGGYNLNVEDAANNTASFRTAMAEAEDKARQVRLDDAVAAYVKLTNEADTLKNAMQDLIDQSGLTEQAIAAYRGLYESGGLANDPTGGLAKSYFDLENELKNVNAEAEKYQAEVQANLDKNQAAAQATKLIRDYNISHGDALKYVNGLLGTSIKESDLNAYTKQQEAEKIASVKEELDSMSEGIEDAADKYPMLADAISQSGMTYDALAQWLYNTGVSVEDFAKGVEEMAAKSADGFNKIDTESGISLEKFVENLQHNKQAMEWWGYDMDVLWNQYGESGETAVQNFLQYLAEAGPEQANLVHEIAESGNLEEIAVAWEEAGGAGRDAYMESMGTLSDEAARVAQEVAESTKQAVEDAVSGNLDIEGNVEITDNIEDVKNNIDGLVKKITDLVNDAYEAKITANENVTSTVDNIETVLRNMTTYKEIEIKTIRTTETRGEQASGGILPGFARGALFDKVLARIPVNASGALNGIVTKPTMTNIGWVGEAGAEAIFHMRHAGGAVVPLTNRRYVRPFAMAVASEMGGSSRPNVTVNMSLNYQAGDDAQMMLRDIERGLENYLNLEA